jgi:DNA-binding MarR family transcriptional regulator
VLTEANDAGGRAAGLDARLAAAAERLGHAARLLLRAAAARHGVSIIQAQLLLRLASDPTAMSSVAALSAWFDVRQPTISDAVSALERKQFVTKTREGGRQRVRLTPTGHAAAAGLSGWDAPLRAALAARPEPDRASALEVMLAAIARLHAVGVITVVRSCTTCRFFRPAAHGTGPRPHHCALLDMPLAAADLRANCPDHEPTAA